MVKVAVICLAYLGNNRGVERLARYFAGSDAVLFLHIDAKTSAKPYLGSFTRHDHVRFIEPRLPIYWGGFSLIDAVLASIGQAMGVAAFTHYLLVTEDSVPLLSVAALFQALSSGREFIQMSLASSDMTAAPNWITDRYTRHYCFDGVATNPRTFNVADKVLTPELCDQIGRAALLLKKGKFPLARLYHGPSWWGLSRTAIDLILSRMKANPWLVESFRFSAIPEEQLFHTLLGDDYAGGPRSNFMYADFSREPKPYLYRTHDECRALQSTGALFARKADIDSQEIDRFVQDLNRSTS